MGGRLCIELGQEDRHGYVAGSRLGPDDPAYSPLLELGFSRQSSPRRESMAHYHEESEEYYVAVQGRLALEVAGMIVSVPKAHLLGVRAGTPHRLAGGRGPVESLCIRVPGGREDKVVLPPRKPGPSDEWFLLDLRVPAPDYRAGACLAADNPAYSPLWDFWSGWGKSLIAWQGQELHYHDCAEEYYAVLRGRLDLEIDGEVVEARPGLLVVVKPGAVHGVVGGREPVDIVFFRVPGGRGDKRVVGGRRFLVA